MIKRNCDLIIISILLLVSINAIIMVVIEKHIIGIQNYVGYSLLVFLVILRILKFRKMRTAIGVFLMLGSFNLIQFTYSTVTAGLSLIPFGQEFKVGFQPLSLLLLIFLVLANFSYFFGRILDIFSVDPRVVQDRQKEIEKHYYNELKQLSDERLKEIVENKNDFPYEEFKVARILLIERQNSISES
ncbi:MAG TPA: hypothetical protein VK172_08080 [Lentimicrobium sp.]|nr:hypothetical protein [Lentimicrobium sp.]